MAGVEPNVMFAARQQVRQHYTVIRQEIAKIGPGDIAGRIAKQSILGIISTYENTAMDKIESGNFSSVDAVLSELDRKMNAELAEFRSRLNIIKPL